MPYASGGSIEAIARDAEGRETARHRIETATRPVSLVVSPETSTWTADGMDLMFLNITAVDSRGRVVPTFDEEMTVDVTGPASFVAMDNGDHYTPTLFQGVTTKPMKGGRMQVILRSTRQQGKVTVKVSTAKLKQSYKTATQNVTD